MNQLFYHPNITKDASEIIFNKEESRHMSKVLRKREGDIFHVTNGKGHIFEVELKDITPKESVGEILSYTEVSPLPYQLHMAVAPTKNNDRFEWFLEKATEIGIHSITPIYCDRSERKVIKPERFEKIIESAMKQSLKAYKPILHPPKSFSECISSNTANNITKCIAHCADGEKVLLKDVVTPSKDVLILIGPEGDFSDKEIRLAKQLCFQEISLGNSRLRTETAAIAACHTVALIHQ